MGVALFDRDITINVGGLRIASRLLDRTRQELGLAEDERTNLLKVAFKIVRTTKEEANKCELSIYNLKKENRIRLQQRKQETIIEAGYVDNVSVIFQGQLEYAQSVLNGRDWITTLQASDGIQKMKTARINASLKGPVTLKDAFSTVTNALGFDPGNVVDSIARGARRGNLTEFTNGLVLSGSAYRELKKLTKSAGVRVFVLDGQLYMLGPNEFLGEQIPLLSSSTGLVGSPEPGEEGFVNVRSLLQPRLLPGHAVRIQSREVEGSYRIEKATYSGDTWGADWFADLECKPLQ